MSEFKKKAGEIDKRVGVRLRAARQQAGISQEAAAAAIGVTFQQLQKYENAANRITSGKLVLLAERYNKDVAWFFGDHGKTGNGNGNGPDVIAQFFAIPHAHELAVAVVGMDEEILFDAVKVLLTVVKLAHSVKTDETLRAR